MSVRKALAVSELVKASACLQRARVHIDLLGDEDMKKRLYELAVHVGIAICNVNKRAIERTEPLS